MMCEFEGCDREAKCKSLCLGHYTQQHRGRPLKPLRAYRYSDTLDGTKTCTRCGVERSTDDYYRHSYGGLYSRCKPCVRELVATRQRELKEKEGADA